jgi:molybdopterin converting factor small subunit
MHINVTFSSLSRILAGVEQEILVVPEGTTVDRLFRILGQKHQNLPQDIKGTYFLVNGHNCTHDLVLAEGDQVLIFQLLGGG